MSETCFEWFSFIAWQLWTYVRTRSMSLTVCAVEGFMLTWVVKLVMVPISEPWCQGAGNVLSPYNSVESDPPGGGRDGWWTDSMPQFTAASFVHWVLCFIHCVLHAFFSFDHNSKFMREVLLSHFSEEKTSADRLQTNSKSHRTWVQSQDLNCTVSTKIPENPSICGAPLKVLCCVIHLTG